MTERSSSPPQQRAQSFKSLLEQPFAKRGAQLSKLGGNLRIAIRGVASWTVVTSGPMAGVHEDPVPYPVAFSIRCDDSVVLQLVTGSLDESSVAQIVESGLVEFDGDLDLFISFTRLLP